MAVSQNVNFRKAGGSTVIVIPKEIITDSRYPFTRPEKDLIIRIAGNKLVIEKEVLQEQSDNGRGNE